MTPARSREAERTASRFEAARTLAKALPGVQEGTSYGTPAFRVRGKLFLRLHQDAEDLVVRIDPDAREALLLANPRCFHVTDHYRAHPWVLVRLASVSLPALRELIENAWRQQAPRSLVEQRRR